MVNTKITDYTDLIAWQEGHSLVLAIYISTKNFPKDELFALTSQLRRAVVSITSNIAEGFSRPTKADKIHFYAMARSSADEARNQLMIAHDLHYIDESIYSGLSAKCKTVHKLLTGLIKSIKERV